MDISKNQWRSKGSVNDYLPNHDFNFNLGKTTLTKTTSTATSHNGVKGIHLIVFASQ